MTENYFDIAVVGAGIAGASAAHALQQRANVILIEQESLPGHHTTGRSAAFLVESYGNHVVRALTRGSRAFLESPPEGFAEVPILKPRPSLWIARADQAERLAVQFESGLRGGVDLRQLNADAVLAMCPALRPGHAVAGVLEPRAMSIDVAELLAGFVRGFRAGGGTLAAGAGVTALAHDGKAWEITCGEQRVRAEIVVNAAGAWAEGVGALAGAHPVGLRPLRRTAITFDPPPSADIAAWPCMIDADEEFYLKPEGAQLLASPCDETPSEPCDAAPDDLGVALAASRVQGATTLEVRTIRRSWAGLRSFVADRSPVIGLDPDCPGFYWLAGQGGSGIMTSPAAAQTIASLVFDGVVPEDLRALGLREEYLSPGRASLHHST